MLPGASRDEGLNHLVSSSSRGQHLPGKDIAGPGPAPGPQFLTVLALAPSYLVKNEKLANCDVKLLIESGSA